MRAIKKLLLRSPWIYEKVQSLRDRKFLEEGRKVGTYSQHGEDLKILDLLVDVSARGPYLDVGCNHPFRLSNTYLLYQRGWRGICVDPLPRYEKLFAKWRPNDTFVCAAVSETPGSMQLFEFQSDVLSTLDSTIADEYVKKGYALRRKTTVPAMPLDVLLAKNSVSLPMSLLSIDIEGYELPALRSMDLDRWKPQVVCLEALTADGVRNEAAIAHLLQSGYEIAYDQSLNIIFRRISSRN